MEGPAIGIIVPRTEGYPILSALRGIEEVFGPRGYEVMITHSHGSSEQEAAIVRLLMEQGIRGVIACVPAETGDLPLFSAFTRRGIPVVFFDQVKKLEGTSSVVIDNHCCGWMAAEHLARQGCRRIALVTSDVRQGVHLQRYEGFLRGLRSFGIPFSEELLIVGGMDEEGGVDAAARLLAMDAMPDAVFVTSDLAAAACMYALKEAGVRVPEDLAIVGFNNEPTSRLVKPSLTTIDYPGAEVGRIAAESLLECLSGGVVPVESRTVIVPVRLIVRHSSLRIKTGERSAAVPY
jgi:LacI family transcriptional regulator